MAGDVSVLLRALSFAAASHRLHRRKDEQSSPYINHPIAVAELLWEAGGIREISTIIAAILHDTIEDTDTSAQEIEEEFGEAVRSVVEEVTDDKKLPKQVRKRLQITHAGKGTEAARQIKLADKISNVQDLVDSPPAGWTLQRRREYVDWAEQVVNGLRGTNPALEQYFDATCARAKRELARAETGVIG
jgi:guanosine-3',5'-bis(diphosphate) 3'-pyrophosphohydrolase